MSYVDYRYVTDICLGQMISLTCNTCNNVLPKVGGVSDRMREIE